MQVFCGICDGKMEVVSSGWKGDKWRCPECDHEVDLPFSNPHGWLQPVAPDCPLDGHSHQPGEFCRGCSDLTGWTPPVFAMEPTPTYVEHRKRCKSCGDADNFRGGQRCARGQELLRVEHGTSSTADLDMRDRHGLPPRDATIRRRGPAARKDFGTFEENLSESDRRFLKELRVGL